MSASSRSAPYGPKDCATLPAIFALTFGLTLGATVGLIVSTRGAMSPRSTPGVLRSARWIVRHKPRNSSDAAQAFVKLGRRHRQIDDLFARELVNQVGKILLAHRPFAKLQAQHAAHDAAND